jgi:putative ABC transport system permease protein
MNDLLQDVRFALRQLAKSRTFTLVAVATLALGIGASAALFSVVDAVLIHPLPYASPDRLVLLWQHDLRTGAPLVEVSYNEFKEWRQQAKGFDGLAALTSTNFRVNLTGRGEPQQVEGALVSAEFFQLLGVNPAHGRNFLAEDDKAGAAPVALMSHGFWKRQFGSDPGLVGSALTLDGTPCTVVGVLPPDVALPKGADLWFPAGAGLDTPQASPYRILKVLGRMTDATTLPAAQASMDVLAKRMESVNPKANAGLGIRVATLTDEIYGDTRPALLLLLAAVGFVVLIACANVANLLLARGAARESELALRGALGAGRSRIVRQLLTESVLLALIAGALGVALAGIAVSSLAAQVPEGVPRLEHVTIDLRVLGFALLLALVTSVLFGLLPALRASQTDPADTLREGTLRASDSRRGRTLRSLLVVSEIAMSLMLLAGAGLMARSLNHLVELDPGFEPKNVLTARISLSDAKYPDQKARTAFFTSLLERMNALPGVESADIVLLRPLVDPIGWDYDFTIEGQTVSDQEKNPPSNYESVSAGYFKTMRIPLLKGRTFEPSDGENGQQVVVVTQALAERFWPGRDPLGQRLKFGGADNEKAPWHTVIGVVGDARYRGWTNPWLDAYIPYQQWNFGRMDLVLRTSAEPLSVVPALRSAVLAGDPELPLADVTTMERAVSQAVAGPRFTALLLGLFAALAVVMAAVGIYGVMATSMARRTREIGVRMALGALPMDVLGLVLRQVATLTTAGVVVGLGLAFASNRAVASLLYGVSSTDPVTFLATAFGLACVAIAAGLLAARRATRVDPMVALRDQ